MAHPITLALSLLTLLPITLHARRPVSYAPEKKPGKTYRAEPWTLSNTFAATLTPSSLLDPYGALLQPGLTYYFEEKFSAGATLGLPLYYVLNNYRDGPVKKINSDYKLRLDLRQYFRLRERRRLYAGIETFYRRQHMTLEHSYFRFLDGHSFAYERVDARKIVFGAGIFLGIDYRLGKRLVAGGHIGAGVRMLHMKPAADPGSMTPRYNATRPTTLLPPGEDQVGDRELNGYLPFGLKVGLLF